MSNCLEEDFNSDVHRGLKELNDSFAEASTVAADVGDGEVAVGFSEVVERGRVPQRRGTCGRGC